MVGPGYSVKWSGRGECIDYSEGEVALALQVTHSSGTRLYCSDMLRDVQGRELTFAQRKRAIRNLCDHFRVSLPSVTFVIDREDPHREGLEALFAGLASEGRKAGVRRDSAARRRKDSEAYSRGLRKAKRGRK